MHRMHLGQSQEAVNSTCQLSNVLFFTLHQETEQCLSHSNVMNGNKVLFFPSHGRYSLGEAWKYHRNLKSEQLKMF